MTELLLDKETDGRKWYTAGDRDELKSFLVALVQTAHNYSAVQLRKEKPRVNKNPMFVYTDKPRVFTKALGLSARTNLRF